MLSVLYACFEGVWRRWFGGGLDFLPNNRFFQHLIGFSVTFLMLHYLKYNIICNILACLALQGLYWARSHGCCFDFGHGSVDEKRYEQLWYWKYLKKYIPENMLHGYACDFLLMNIRYTLPAILMGIILFNIPIMFAGLVLSGVYALCWACYDLGWTKNPTENAEMLGGFLTGLLLTM
ncbi:MAG: hypothetical protein IJV75_00215 [Alphaproteobacteria bacterium]|nr:hypothetical protein [Alphaproteobacteria bacterium]